MPVYVDAVRFRYRRYVMCHMWVDSDAELDAMAQAIGLKRDWLQAPPKASWRHYDVSLSRKRDAIARGAIETDRYGAVEHRARLHGDMEILRQIANVRARRRASLGGCAPDPARTTPEDDR